MNKIKFVIFLSLLLLLPLNAEAKNSLLEVGDFSRIYDPSIGEKEKWYINDHCFIRADDGKWHLFGITHAEPANPIDEDNFAHATADSLLQKPWHKEAFALSVKQTWNEKHLWAPHVIFHDGLYYMFYCAGDNDNTKYKIHLATSKDLYQWKRHPANPMIVDGYDARDPFILKVGNEWVMYYTATSKPEGGNHIVTCQTSKDLIHWADKKTVFVDPSIGTWGGPTESPTVVRRGKYYYLFIGPRDDYRRTSVYRSEDPFSWKIENEVGRFNSHAAEVIRDDDGKWYVSHCGWGQGGVYLAPLNWKDGLSDEDTSIPVPTAKACKGSAFKSFVYRTEDKLMDENGELKFISFNIPNLHYNEDYMPFTETNPWRLTDEFEIRDALEAVRQMGGQVVRTYTLSVKRNDDHPDIPRHVLGPGQFNEEAFKVLDKVLEVANQKGIRVIIPFVDNWKWWGGVAQYSGFRGKENDDFWTDPQLFDDFKKPIDFVINRTNTYTGVKYLDDKAILAWETGNELTCPHEWTHKVAAYIKSIDKNHLVLDGYHTTVLRDESLTDPYIDVVTTHHYSKNPNETITQIKQSIAKAKGKKPYFVGEFGFIPTEAVREILDTVIQTGTKGALIWSLRYRNREGGFYWHSEPYGGDLFKAYHWPGFDSGKPYDERNLMKLMRQKAYEIQGLPVPPLPKSAPPTLLAIADPASISWQGSAGAEYYTIQRSCTKDGPWTIVGDNISDAAVQYRPLFKDESVEPGMNYYYRVIAVNTAGKSAPSNVVGPVFVKNRTLVDEMQNLNQVFKHKGTMSLESKEARKFKEDYHRLKAQKGNYVIYKVDGPIHSWKLYAFFEKEIFDFKFSVSSNGTEFTEVPSRTQTYFTSAGDYDYHKPVLFRGSHLDNDPKYLKITWPTQAQVGRIEIAYSRKKSSASRKR
jgi:predicted GH43/DUF377 family glycosyl hydrolase